uniref:Uncharacterized protein n=1 Tax=Anguilla anguilla TaxID=7936 RepID=A0A0E9SH21_ANGAN
MGSCPACSLGEKLGGKHVTRTLTSLKLTLCLSHTLQLNTGPKDLS